MKWIAVDKHNEYKQLDELTEAYMRGRELSTRQQNINTYVYHQVRVDLSTLYIARSITHRLRTNHRETHFMTNTSLTPTT